MLHREAVPPSTLDLLIRLCAHPATEGFALAGGTSLALRFGHRLSVDLDFFTPHPFDADHVVAVLGRNFEIRGSTMHGGGMALDVEGVKLDFVTYRYPLLQPFELIEDIRLFSLQDVVGMKLSAVTNRGAKKDFYDLAELLERVGLEEMIRIYSAKYPNHDPMIMLRCLTYFDDAEFHPDPESLTGQTWPDVQRRIQQAVKKMM